MPAFIQMATSIDFLNLNILQAWPRMNQIRGIGVLIPHDSTHRSDAVCCIQYNAVPTVPDDAKYVPRNLRFILETFSCHYQVQAFSVWSQLFVDQNRGFPNYRTLSHFLQ
jgi:hypothetical protein